jgi:hypothetical protein
MFFFIIILNLKVRCIFFVITIHLFLVRTNHVDLLKKVFFFSFFFLFFFLGNNLYGVPSDDVVTGVLDMRSKKHNLHFFVGGDLLPHTIVNIPHEKIHMGVFVFIISFIFFSFFFFFILY